LSAAAPIVGLETCRNLSENPSLRSTDKQLAARQTIADDTPALSPRARKGGLIGRPSDARLKNNHRNSISCGRRGPAARSRCNSTWHNPRVSAALAAPPIEKSFTLVIDDACSKSAGHARDDTGAGRAEPLQFEPRHLGHSYIEQQVAALSRVVICEERAGRWKTLPQSIRPRSINRSPCQTARLHAAPNERLSVRC
jgi:hypothetical protein